MMKKFFILLVIILFVYFTVNALRWKPPVTTAQAQVITTNTQYPSPTFAPTQTPIPSATIGYESTLAIAQSTADEARRINAMVTSEHEQRILDQLQLTAAHESRVQEIYSWTATAALTSVPLTATAQVVVSTQIANGQNIIAAQLTATNQAPTQYAAMARIQNVAKFSRVNEILKIFALLGLTVFLFGVGAFALRWKPIEPKPEPDPQTETIVMMKHDRGNGSLQLQRMVIPCSPEQLTELALKVTTGKKTLAINNWEGSDTLFTRPIILQVRGWMRINQFAVATDDNQLVPTTEGFDFFAGWLESQKLPDDYQFTEPEVAEPENPVADMDLKPV